MKNPSAILSAAAGLWLLAASAPLQGAILPVSGVTASTQFEALNPVRTINSSGLTGTTATEGEIGIATHDNNGNGATMWHSAVVAAAGQSLTWTFASPSDLRTIYYWNHNQNNLTDRGIKDFTLSISKDGGSTWTSAGTYVLERAGGLSLEKAKTLELPATLTGVTNVRFEIASNYGGNVVGLAEIRFSDLPLIPPDPTGEFISLQGIVLNNDRTTGQRIPFDLYWYTENANSVSISPAPGPVSVEDFIQVTPPPDADTVYTLTATGSVNTLQIPLTLRTVIGGSSNWRYVRFTPVKLRDTANANSIQIADISFASSSGMAVAPVAVTNPDGDNPEAQGPEKVIDGDITTKWLDFNKSGLIFDFGANPTPWSDYTIQTAEDAPPRDVVRWSLEGSNDQNAWTLIDNVTAFDYPMPATRNFATMAIPLPGASLVPLVSFTGDSTTLSAGDPLTLTWQTTSATTVSIDQGIGTVAVNGSVSIIPAADTTYTLTATTAAGRTTTATFSVDVATFAIQNIAYANFNSSANELALIGNASVLSDSRATADPTAGKRLRLNNDAPSLTGAAWFRKRQHVAAGFESTFGLNFLNFDTAEPFGGADGVAFVIQNSAAGATALPATGPERGLPSNALNITFDSYLNDDEESSATLQVRAGSTLLRRVDLAALSGIVLTQPSDLTQKTASAAPYQIRVVYAPGDLDVYVDGVLAIDSLNVNLQTIGAVDDSGMAFAGFCARSGAAYESHDVTAWTLTEASAPATTPLALVAWSMNPTGGTASFTWQSSTGKSYRVAASSNLADWSTHLQTGITAAAGNSTSASVSFTPGQVRFFRIEEE